MDILPLIVVVPLVAAGLLVMIGSHLTRAAAEAVTLTATVAMAVLCALALARTGDGLEVYWFGGWEPREGIAIGVDFAVDSVGAGLALLVSALLVAAVVLMWRYRDTDAPHFQALMLLFGAGMTGFCLSGDLFNMFVFFELMSVAAFALAGFKVEEESVEGSLNFAITNTIGSFLLLLGIGLVYARTGALNLAQIGEALTAGGPADGLVVVAFALLVCGFLVKAAVVPFHFWLADAYAVAPTPVCLLFAGAMSELGIYGVGRLWFSSFGEALAGQVDELRAVLIVAGCVTALVGGVMCFAQDHLKRLLAFATISYVGVFMLGLGLLTTDGVAGASLYVVADGFGKAALFGAVGILQHRWRMVSELRLRGRGRVLPVAAGVTLLGALSFVGVPPFGTFFAKAVLEEGLVHEGYGWVIAVLIAASVLTGGAVLRYAGRVFAGWGKDEDASPTTADEEGQEEEGSPGRPPAALVVPVVLLGLASLVVGLVPGMVGAFEQAAERFLDGHAYGRAVLDGAAPLPIPEPPPFDAKPSAYLYAAITLAGSVALAAFALFGQHLRAPLARRLDDLGSRAMAPLHALHSGHVGDYVTFLVLGVAVFGGAFALALG